MSLQRNVIMFGSRVDTANSAGRLLRRESKIWRMSCGRGRLRLRRRCSSRCKAHAPPLMPGNAAPFLTHLAACTGSFYQSAFAHYGLLSQVRQSCKVRIVILTEGKGDGKLSPRSGGHMRELKNLYRGGRGQSQYSLMKSSE